MSVVKKFAQTAAAAALVAAMGAQAQVSDQVVRIGLLTDMSGPYSSAGGRGTEIAARMALEDWGDKVAGARVELLVADHQNKADIAAGRAREWAEREKVDAYLELINSAVAMAVSDIAKRNNKVALIIGGGTTQLTNEACHPGVVHYAYDTYAMATGTANALMDEGYQTWFFVTADYAFGHSLERDVSNVVKKRGGKILGSVRHPHPTTDFSSFMLQAQSSGAEVIALANAGPDFANAVRSANEFGITQKQQAAGMIATLAETHAMGLDISQGLYLTTAFYWDRDEASREWSKRFFERAGFMPNMFHSGTYSALTNYLKAIEKAGSDDRDAVITAMRNMSLDDFYISNGKLREDGRVVHDMYLAQIKSPKESKYPWDYYRIVRTIPGDSAFMPLSESKCDLVKKQ